MLLKFAYDGMKFYGYQRQKNVRTVEGDIINVLRKFSIAENIKSASRTDRGVSALGNVIQIKTNMDVKKLMGILNSNLQHIYFHSYALENLNPRHAERRWYRYHLMDLGYDVNALKQAAAIFEGEHDFRYFTRVRKNTVLKIDKIDVEKNGSIITIDFYARNYLWNLIRRIVAAMEKFALGYEFDEEVFDKRYNFGLASPEPLVLMDVEYNFPFVQVGIPRKLRRELARKYLQSLIYAYLSGENYKSFKFI